MADKKPNILILFGDDIGMWNVSYFSRGQMGYRTPNIDRVANEGVAFTDYYAPAELYGGPGRVHHRTESRSYRSDEGRHAWRDGRACRPRIRRSPSC